MTFSRPVVEQDVEVGEPTGDAVGHPARKQPRQQFCELKPIVFHAATAELATRSFNILGTVSAEWGRPQRGGGLTHTPELSRVAQEFIHEQHDVVGILRLRRHVLREQVLRVLCLLTGID